MPRVFLPHQSGPLARFAKAERFGQLVPILRKDTYPDNAQDQIPMIAATLKTQLDTFNPMQDFVLLAGDPIIMSMAILVLSMQTLHIPVLKWDSKAQDYYVIELSL